MVGVVGADGAEERAGRFRQRRERPGGKVFGQRQPLLTRRDWCALTGVPLGEQLRARRRANQPRVIEAREPHAGNMAGRRGGKRQG